MNAVPTPKLTQAFQRHKNAYLDEFGLIRPISSAGTRVARSAIYVDRRFTMPSYPVGVLPTGISTNDMTELGEKAYSDARSVDERLYRRPSGKRLLFVTGEGGSGKTEFVRNLAHHLLASADLLDPEHARLPVWISLKSAESPHPLADQLHADRWLSEPSAIQDFLLKNGNITFIIDGLDEFPTELRREVFEHGLRQWIRSYPNCAYVLTGRTGSLRSLNDPFDDFQIELAPLSPTDVYAYVSRWSSHISPQHVAGRERLWSHDPLVLRICQQPLFLAIICEYCSDLLTVPSIPHSPVDLMELCLGGLLERRVGHRSTLTLNECLDYLGLLFAHGLKGGFVLHKHNVQQLLSTVVADPNVDMDEVRALLENDSGIIARIGQQYRASNRMVAEFLAARWLVNHESLKIQVNDRNGDRRLAETFGDLIWSQDHRELLRWISLLLEQRGDIATMCHLVRWLEGHLARPKIHGSTIRNHGSSCDDQWETLRYALCSLCSIILASPHAKDGYRTATQDILNHFARSDMEPELERWFRPTKREDKPRLRFPVDNTCFSHDPSLRPEPDHFDSVVNRRRLFEDFDYFADQWPTDSRVHGIALQALSEVSDPFLIDRVLQGMHLIMGRHPHLRNKLLPPVIDRMGRTRNDELALHLATVVALHSGQNPESKLCLWQILKHTKSVDVWVQAANFFVYQWPQRKRAVENLLLSRLRRLSPSALADALSEYEWYVAAYNELRFISSAKADKWILLLKQLIPDFGFFLEMISYRILTAFEGNIPFLRFYLEHATKPGEYPHKFDQRRFPSLWKNWVVLVSKAGQLTKWGARAGWSVRPETLNRPDCMEFLAIPRDPIVFGQNVHLGLDPALRPPPPEMVYESLARSNLPTLPALNSLPGKSKMAVFAIIDKFAFEHDLRIGADGGKSLQRQIKAKMYKENKNAPIIEELDSLLHPLLHQLAPDSNAQSAGPNEMLQSRGMSWQEVKRRAEKHCTRNAFPGVRAMARLFGCSSSTVCKAIHNSTKLSNLAAEQNRRKKKKTTPSQLSPGHAEAFEQTRELDPDQDTAEVIFAKLLELVEDPTKRDELVKKTPKERQELVLLLQEDPAAFRALFNLQKKSKQTRRRPKG